MNAERVPFEAPKERSRVCFGGFRPTKHVEEPWALARGAPLFSVKPASVFIPVEYRWRGSHLMSRGKTKEIENKGGE